MQSQKTIGVILGSIGELFQSHVWPGIADALSKRGIGIIVYSGKIPKTTEPADRELEVIYGFPDPSRIDGILLFSSVLCNFIEGAEYTDFYSRYENMPLVAISRETGDNPCVLVDNFGGMTSLVDHFIEDHGYRNIAFIQGPIGSIEAEDRYRAYCSSLEHHGIRIDERLVVRADFIPEAGSRAAKILLDERKVPFDALIAANDGALLGALSIFRERGIRVPADVCAGGFDDVDEARTHIPPLTTVSQPLYTLGHISADILADMLEGKKASRVTLIPTHLVLRSSCGCSSISRISPEQLEKTLREELSRLCPRGAFARLFSAYLEQHTDKNDIDPLIAALVDRDVETPDAEDNTRNQEILGEARNILREHQGRIKNWRQFADQLSFLKNFSRSLSASLTLSEIFSVLETCVKGIGIKECYLSLSEGHTRISGIIVEPPEHSQLVFAWKNGERITLPDGGLDFKTKRLVPETFAPDKGRASWIVYPMVFKEENFGFVIFDLENAARTILYTEFIHDQLSAALKNVHTLDNLKKARERLLHSEKMASLGEMTAGIAHELKNPLNFVINFAESMRDTLSELQESPAESLEKTLKELDFSADRILFHGNKANTIIHAMLNQARGDTGKTEKVNVNSLLAESIALARHSYKIQHPESNVEIVERYDFTIPEIVAFPAQLNRVLINILSNAIYSIHQKSKENPHFKGRIMVSTAIIDTSLRVIIEDNGLGMSEDTRRKLFQPFFTTKPANEGTGLGLKICHDIIVDGHGGKIEVDSREGEFARFTLLFSTGL